MKSINLNLNSSLSEYQFFFEADSECYRITIVPIKRMGVYSLTETKGAAEITLNRKNDRYPKDFKYGDQVSKKTVGGRSLHGDVAKEITRLMSLVGFKLEQNTCLVWSENRENHRIRLIN